MSANPRRRAPQLSTSPKMLRKSETFSARTGLQSELCTPLENSQYTLQRSPTTLDIFLNRPENYIAAQRAQLEDFLKNIEDCVKNPSDEAGIALLNNQETIAIPAVVGEQDLPEPMLIDEKKDHPEHHHGSDSGLGSSIDTPIQDARTIASSFHSVGTAGSIHSAITRSFGVDSTLSHGGPELSTEGLKQIEERILNPILGKAELKEFHPLVKQIPESVDLKHITNLRDIEKTFLYGSPVSLRTYLAACAVAYYQFSNEKRFSGSAKSFKKFWNFTIQCLHSTVDFLPERDQRRPSDRPYTNSYFLDLVEQIRRYAEIMRRTREKQENGEALDEMDFSPDEGITVQGGLSNNGRFAQLVRNKDGKTLPLAPQGSHPEMSIKRQLDDSDYEDDDDDVLRSMARRRKSDKAGDVMHVCSTCRKEFKRPCDLTKHEKTHSRPFKCCEKSCRYYEVGWPTEKERDRHVNDKHSSAPQMYHCMFPPCSYSSKRESNCKQHMEKAHGWEYVRSKSNGRKRAMSMAGSSRLTPATPMTPLDATPLGATPSSHFTPETNFAPSPSPWWNPENNFSYAESSNMAYSVNNRRDSITTAATNYTYSSGFSPDQIQAALDTVSPIENFNFNSNSPPLFTSNGMDMDFNMNNTTNAVFQPTSSLATGDFNFDMNFTTAGAEMQPQISPIGQTDLTLFSPQDEGFGDSLDFGGQDFLLFPNTVPNNQNNSTWFPDLEKAQFNSTQFDSLAFDPTASMFPQ